jgi:hypothetical protein
MASRRASSLACTRSASTAADERLALNGLKWVSSLVPKGTHFETPTGVSVLEKGLEIAADMHDAKDKHVHVFNTVNDDILPHCHAAASGAEIVIAGTSDIGEARQHEKAVGEGVD